MILTPRAHNHRMRQKRLTRAQLQGNLARYPQTLVIVDDHFALLSACHWYPVIAEKPLGSDCPFDVKTLGPDLRPPLWPAIRSLQGKLRLRLNSGSQWVSHLLQGFGLRLPGVTRLSTHDGANSAVLRRPAANVGGSTAATWHWSCPLVTVWNMWLPLEDNNPIIAFCAGKVRLAGAKRSVWRQNACPRPAYYTVNLN